MKQLLVLFFLFLSLLCGCTTDADRSRMRSGLDSINQRNRNDQPFTVADVQPYADFFDRHGTANDRLLAHYLLGRAYYEAGEAPMALQCYQQAIECADTTAEDCDYYQLSRVYSQLGLLFYYQHLFQQQIEAYKKASYYTLRANQPSSAIIEYEHIALAYELSGMTDSAMSVLDSVASWYNNLEDSQNVAIVNGRWLSLLIKKGDYLKARKCMDSYEQFSGFFDDERNISAGREIYYYYKGLILLHEGEQDSAESCFRKLLRTGKDYNHQIAGAIGLAKVFERKGWPDSTAKYFKYGYEMNDSMYADKVTGDVERIQAMYDYSRSQKIAQQKAKEAQNEKQKRKVVITAFILFFLVSVAIIYAIMRKSKTGLMKYRMSINELQQIRSELDALYVHKNEYGQIIDEKNKKIHQLEKAIKKYGKQMFFNTANAERCLRESPSYQQIAGMAARGEKLTDDNLSTVNKLVDEYLPAFDDFMTTYKAKLKPDEYNICILLRLHFIPVEISGMLGISKSLVSQHSTNVMRKIFEAKGSSKELSAKLTKLF